MIRTLPVLAFTIGLAACTSSDDGNDGEIVGVPVPEPELPETNAETTCELIYECSCANPDQPDQPTCVDEKSSDFSEAQLAAQAAGLIYDDQCAGDLVAKAKAAGCAPTLDLDCSSFCATYHGDVVVDDLCTAIPGQPSWSDCASGLWCITGICVDPCGLEESFLQLGDACRDETGSLGQCDPAPSLFCDSATDTCIALPGIGEPCYLGEICSAETVCDFSAEPSVCAALPGAGEPCAFACVAGYFCDGGNGEGTCAPLPALGESCADSNSACAVGLVCNEAQTCEALPAWICE